MLYANLVLTCTYNGLHLIVEKKRKKEYKLV